MLAEKREEENCYLWLELARSKREEGQEADPKPRPRLVLESKRADLRSKEPAKPNVNSVAEYSGIPIICDAGQMQYGMTTSTADVLPSERRLSVGTVSTASTPEETQWVLPAVLPSTTAAEFYPPPPADSGQVLQHLVASVADKQHKCPKFSGESKYDDFDHWFLNIFRFYVSLDRYEEQGKLLELRSALKEGSPAQRAFDFLELLSHGSFVQATQRLSERFRCMLTTEALCVEFSRLRFRYNQQMIQDFATEVEQIFYL